MSKLIKILKDYWGYDSFRYPQEEIITSAINGQDTIALLATGAGKSICFQVAGLALEGLCLVISPLIALMDDQVERLQEMGIQAEAIHSARSMKDVDRILNNAYYGKLKFLYLSPERLESDIVKERLLDLNITLVAVDEAHCVSQWGFDFRPSYLRIGLVRELLKKTVFMALTATASSQVLEDIQEHIDLKMPTIFKTSFLRANISLNVIFSIEKKKECIQIVKRINGSGIVYVRSRYQCENLAETFEKNGVSAMFYHAGLKSNQRKTIQKKWQAGQYRIVVATNAFGMGIDKSNVRFVLHYDTPDKPEEYYQEAGRAGRDGLPATAILLYNEEDTSKMNKFFKQRFPSIEEIKLLFHRICVFLNIAVGSGLEQQFDFDIDLFCQKYSYNNNFVTQGIKTIEYSGWFEYIHVNQKTSTLQITIPNRELRSILRHRPKVEAIINAILRMYESIFFEAVDINEEKISKLSRIDRLDIVKILKAMDKREWLVYDEHNIEGKLFFVYDRPPDINFNIDNKHYNYLKKMSKLRLQAIKDYIGTTQCRQKELLTYFGEYLKEDCRNCDICLGVNETEFSPQNRIKSVAFIKDRLAQRQMTLKTMISLWPYNKRKRIIKLISVLENENHIEITKGMVKWIS